MKNNHSSNNKLAILQQVNSVMRKRFFSHHPDCDRYDHHVIKIGEWAFCIGDTAMYLTMGLLFVLNQFNSKLGMFNQLQHFIIGSILFLPAIVQLKYKSKKKPIKFLMRSFLGASAYFYLVFIFQFAEWYWKLVKLSIFISGVIIYSLLHKTNSLPECKNCVYGQNYDTCLIKVSKLLQIQNLELIRDDIPIIDYYLKVQAMSEN